MFAFYMLILLLLTMTFAFSKKWMPVAKEKLVTLKKNAEPYVQMVSEKSVELYQTSSDFIRPHLVNAHKVADPYFQVHFKHLRSHKFCAHSFFHQETLQNYRYIIVRSYVFRKPRNYQNLMLIKLLRLLNRMLRKLELL
jgi:hypothetical protein